MQSNLSHAYPRKYSSNSYNVLGKIKYHKLYNMLKQIQIIIITVKMKK